MEQKKENRIPEFKSREEEAEWFDTHDMADYQNEFKTVKASFAKNLSEGLNIRLDKETLATLRVKARQQGIGPTTLARMWIIDHLRELEKSKTRTGTSNR
jgi:predicted DNA binding CopG/RHH family protein